MHSLRVEHIQTSTHAPLAHTIASKVVERSHCGKIVIVAEKPTNMLSALRKQWLLVERRIWKTRARTLNAVSIRELSSELAHMQRLRFTAKPPDDILEADVTVATAEHFLRAAPMCQTMLITCVPPKEVLHMITSWMPRGGVVVIYGQK
jgi:hypothetical protein